MNLANSVLRASSKILFKQVRKRLGEQQLPVKVRLWSGEEYSPSGPVKTEVALRRPRALWTLANPSLGNLARAYVEEDIDLVGDTRSMLEVGELLCRDSAVGHARKWGLMSKWRHSKSADKKAIAYHYDVSNEFYQLWLDSGLVYSCAYFRHDSVTLDAAQEQKLDHICRKLMLEPEERFLDIGCGWGALLLRAAQQYRTRATGVTLSRLQYEYVSAQIKDRGLEDRCEVRLMDYRDIPDTEQYDKIASVGMFEHVGVPKLPDYFSKIYRLLKPGGLAMNHGITSMGINDVDAGPDTDEFIQGYVFPEGELTHVSRVIEAMAEQRLECWDAECLRPHYAKTLWHWVGRLEAHRREAVALVGEKNYRIWQIYMAGSAWAFERGWLSIYQLLAGRPDPSGKLCYPLTREHIYVAKTPSITSDAAVVTTHAPKCNLT
ncbi:MAG: class I SAM-dependent methyltransferase [Burkholderiales bacterium]